MTLKESSHLTKESGAAGEQEAEEDFEQNDGVAPGRSSVEELDKLTSDDDEADDDDGPSGARVRRRVQVKVMQAGVIE